jgi:5'-nucleotidase/UDP-sugar diphosphatase
MKRIIARLGALLSAALLLVGALPPAARADTPMMTPDSLTILFTHDTHDHFLPSPAEGGGEYGGYTRLATLLKQERAAAAADTAYGANGRAVVTLDGGDFSMGSLFQTVYATEAPELRALGAMGYDVTTLGNHEFDYRASGLADMLNAAAASGEVLPALVQANYQPPQTDQRSWDAWENYGVTDYVVLERPGFRGKEQDVLRVAVFGVLGVDADECAPMSGMEFTPIAEAARRVVAEIQEQAAADYIICLSHSGTTDGKGEDHELAKAVDGIDVIVSGHTHSTTEEPIRVNDTLIVSCGEYTQNLGVLTIGRSGSDGAVTCEEYRLVPVDETVPDDPEMAAMAARFKKEVDTSYLAGYGLSFDQVLAQSPFDFTPIGQFAQTQEEDPLGSLIADSYIYAVQQAEGEDYVPVDFAVVASGVIRASFAKGDISTSDAFNVSSLGSGGDGTPGYPLVSVWLTGRELKDAFEVDASVTPLMPAAQLYPAGMTWSYNPNRMIFNKVTSCAQVLPDGSVLPLEDDRLYRVVTGLYSGQMLGAVNAKSLGILSITPKDAQGLEIDDYEAHIIHNANGSEVKEWYALASYLQSMGTVDSRYAASEGRKVSAPSWNPVELLKHPNWITLLVLLVALAVIVLVVFLAYRIATRGRRTRYCGKRRGSGYRPYRG